MIIPISPPPPKDKRKEKPALPFSHKTLLVAEKFIEPSHIPKTISLDPFLTKKIAAWNVNRKVSNKPNHPKITQKKKEKKR